MNKNILEHFKFKDNLIYQNLIKYDDLNINQADNYFAELCKHIIYQQLAGKAADTIYSRYLSLLSGKENISESILDLSSEALRSVGLSKQKANYIHNIANFFITNKNELKSLPQLSDKDIISILTRIKGVGTWTAEMFLIFTLGRPDVFSFKDLGLKKGFEKLYGVEFRENDKKIIKIINNWAPYKSYASLVLWKILDTK